MPLADDIRRRLGIAPQRDRDDAAAYMTELSHRHDAPSRLARDMAEAMVPRDPSRRPDPDGMVRLALPSLQDDARPLPKDPEMRRRFIAQATMSVAVRQMETGSDEGLVPTLGRAAREDAVRHVPVHVARTRGIERTLAEAARTSARTVAAYLSDGSPIREHMATHLLDVPKRGETPRTLERLRDVREFHPRRQPAGGAELRDWVRDGLDAERTAARAGLIEPARVVRIAAAVMQGADVERLSTYPRARPDYEATGRMDREERAAAFSKERDRSKAARPDALQEPSPLRSMSPAMLAEAVRAGRTR